MYFNSGRQAASHNSATEMALRSQVLYHQLSIYERWGKKGFLLANQHADCNLIMKTLNIIYS